MFRGSARKLVIGTVRVDMSSSNTGIQNVYLEYERNLQRFQTPFDQLKVNALIDPNTYTPKYHVSKDLTHAKAQMRHFYRKICRAAPMLLAQYNMVYLPPKKAMEHIRYKFSQKNPQSAEAYDNLRYNAEMQFLDIARMHYTVTHMNMLFFTEKAFAPLPELPVEALPAHVDPLYAELVNSENKTPFYREFLDPQENRRQRLTVPGPVFY